MHSSILGTEHHIHRDRNKIPDSYSALPTEKYVTICQINHWGLHSLSTCRFTGWHIPTAMNCLCMWYTDSLSKYSYSIPNFHTSQRMNPNGFLESLENQTNPQAPFFFTGFLREGIEGKGNSLCPSSLDTRKPCRFLKIMF